jgi:internalin A
MKTTSAIGALLLSLLALLACDAPKNEPANAVAEAAPPSVPATVLPSASATAPPAPAASATWKKRTLADCKPHPTAVDFGDDKALENEVRRKTAKAAGTLAPSDLAQIKSINLASAPTHQIDPCIFPMFSSLKDLFLGPGEFDDLTPLQKLTNLETLRASLSQVSDLHAIEGLKRMDRLDLSHTLITDSSLKAVGSLVNVTELTLDEDAISDLTPIANMKKLEKLSIKKTQVKDLTPLSNLKALKALYIADTPVADISPVSQLIKNGLKLIQN